MKHKEIKPNFLLIDLPVFPKGVIALSLPLLAGYLKNDFNVKILDINFFDWDKLELTTHVHNAAFVGIKVSSQSFRFAKEITARIKSLYPNVQIIWGGELPTLQPEECLEYADTIVTKRIEGCLEPFLTDLKSNQLKRKYEGSSGIKKTDSLPDFKALSNPLQYYSFMGYPIETSGGCDKFCRFCMVHTMQNGVIYKPHEQLKLEINNIGKKFLNVLDYNIGISKEHLMGLCKTIQQTDAIGWMGEMCLESLDDDEILQALSDSRCKIIYCGLESIDEDNLKSINKNKTNNPANYSRIIKKAQSYGVNIATGIIVGLEGTKENTFQRNLDFFLSCGVIYAKITFLTYNPGTFFHKSMMKNGTYLTTEIDKFDGNNLTYLPHEVDKDLLYQDAKKFIRNFYSLKSIIKRAKIAEKKPLKRVSFILFNYCYSKVYFDWLKFGVLSENNNRFNELIKRKFKKSLSLRATEFLLNKII